MGHTKPKKIDDTKLIDSDAPLTLYMEGEPAQIADKKTSYKTVIKLNCNNMHIPYMLKLFLLKLPPEATISCRLP